MKEVGIEDPALEGFKAGALRKAFADLGHNTNDPTISKNMAKFMAHSIKTRDAHYLLADTTHEMANTARAVYTAVVNSPPEQDKVIEPDLVEDSTEDSDEESENEGVGEEEKGGVEASKKPYTKNFSPAELAMLKAYFIEDNKATVTNKAVNEAIEANKDFSNMWDRLLTQTNGSSRAAIQKIRSAIKRPTKK